LPTDAKVVKIIFSAQKSRCFYGWYIVGAGFFISLIGMGARYSFGVFVKSFDADFGMTRAATSGIFSAYMLLCCLLAATGGWALDKYGPRKVGIFMGVFTGFSLILTSRVRAPWQLLITYSLFLSLGTGPAYGVVNSTTSRWFVKKRGIAVGITSAGGGVGAIVLAPFATYLISNFDWRTAFIVLGFTSGIGMIAASFLLIKEPSRMGHLPYGMNSRQPTDNIPPEENILDPPGVPLQHAWKMNQFWLLGLSWLFLSLALHMVFIHVVPYAVDTGIPPMDAAFILSMIGLANIPGRLTAGKLSDMTGTKALGVSCALIQLGALLWLMDSSKLWMFYVFALIYGFLWGASATVITLLTVDIFGTPSLGTIMGMMSSGWAIGAAIGPAVGGYLFDVTGHYHAAFLAGTAALFTAACLMGMIRKVGSSGKRVPSV
jgi:OFA family oxalate/formate antiporter-like MFS transporter